MHQVPKFRDDYQSTRGGDGDEVMTMTTQGNSTTAFSQDSHRGHNPQSKSPNGDRH